MIFSFLTGKERKHDDDDDDGMECLVIVTALLSVLLTPLC